VLFVPLDLFGGVLYYQEIPPTEEELRKIKRASRILTIYGYIFCN
jgi:hypothetical protein